MSYPYSTKEYARGFNKESTPFFLQNSNTWVLKQPIFDTEFDDLKSCYPRYALSENIELLENDLKALYDSKLVSFTCVTDAFICPTQEKLDTLFEHIIPFKTHYTINYALPITISKHHRYEIKQAKKGCHVEIVNLSDYFKEWNTLYTCLAERHEINEHSKLSEFYFDTLTKMDNLITAIAFDNNKKAICMHLWFAHQKYLYSHLAASSPEGYAARAAYAIYDFMIEHFYNKYDNIDFGGCAGNTDDSSHGLARFKKGFSNESKTSYLCGKILNRDAYYKLCKPSSSNTTQFFPRYRLA